jgi:hypothetical protein
MTADQVILKAFTEAKRKASLPTGSKYSALLVMLDNVQKMWAAREDWQSLRATVTLTALITATDTFSLDNSTGTVDRISQKEDDYVLLTDGTSTKRVNVVAPNQLDEYRYSIVCAKIGSSLKFSSAFAADSAYLGYSIKVPCQLKVADITDGDNTVAVNDPMWAVYQLAADYVRNDVVARGEYEHLNDMADEHWQSMLDAEGGQLDAVVTNWRPEGEAWL